MCRVIDRSKDMMDLIAAAYSTPATMKTSMPRFVCMALLALSFFTTSASAQNLVTNPGFEAGSAGWTISGWGAGFGTAHTGTNIAATGCVGAACMNAVGGAYISQTVATVAGTTYAVSLWYRTDAGNPTELQVLFGTAPLTNGGAGTCTGNCIIQTTTNTGGTWVQLTATATATSASTQLQILGRHVPAVIYIDDVSVVSNAPASPASIPTLSEWAMLALSSILALLGTIWISRKRA